MIIKVKGAVDRLMLNRMKLACGFFAQKLFKKQMLPYVQFNVIIQKKLITSGCCGPIYPSRPREFEIEIRQQSRMAMLTILAHEMIHCKQFAYGELKEKYIKQNHVMLWKGEIFSNDIDYWDQPWEIEAYGLENFS